MSCATRLGARGISWSYMADDDDVAEDWEDVDTEVGKLLTKNLVQMSQLA